MRVLQRQVKDLQAGQPLPLLAKESVNTGGDRSASSNSTKVVVEAVGAEKTILVEQVTLAGVAHLIEQQTAMLLSAIEKKVMQQVEAQLAQSTRSQQQHANQGQYCPRVVGDGGSADVYGGQVRAPEDADKEGVRPGCKQVRVRAPEEAGKEGVRPGCRQDRDAGGMGCDGPLRQPPVAAQASEEDSGLGDLTRESHAEFYKYFELGDNGRDTEIVDPKTSLAGQLGYLDSKDWELLRAVSTHHEDIYLENTQADYDNDDDGDNGEEGGESYPEMEIGDERDDNSEQS